MPLINLWWVRRVSLKPHLLLEGEWPASDPKWNRLILDIPLLGRLGVEVEAGGPWAAITDSHPEPSVSSAGSSKLEGSDRIERSAVWERDDGICGICHEPVIGRWHLDHIVPMSRGGSHTYDNVQVSHPACNLRKHSRLPATAYQDREV